VVAIEAAVRALALAKVAAPEIAVPAVQVRRETVQEIQVLAETEIRAAQAPPETMAARVTKADETQVSDEAAGVVSAAIRPFTTCQPRGEFTTSLREADR